MTSPIPDITLSDCALLVIDMQNDFLSEKGYFAERGIDLTPFQRTIPRVKAMVEFARSHAVPVIFTEQRYDPRGLDWPEKLHRVLPANFRNKQGGPRKEGVCIAGSQGAKVIEELAPGPQDHLLGKRRFSAFYRTDLEDLLRYLGKRVLLFTGITTEICVESTVRDAFFRDYEILVLEDCTAAWTEAAQRASLQVIDFAFGMVVNSREFASRF